MTIDHDNEGGDRRAKSRWLAPGVLERARELTEGIRTSVDKPSSPAAPEPQGTPDRERRRAASEWAPAPPPETTDEKPVDDEPRGGSDLDHGLDPDAAPWRPPPVPRQAPPVARQAPSAPTFPPQPTTRPRTPLARRVRNLTLRSQAYAPVTPRSVVVAVALVATAGVAGLLVGRSGGDPEPKRVSTPEFAIILPGDWDRRPGTGDTGPLGIGGAVVAGPADQPDAGIAAGTLPAAAAPGSRALARPLDPTPPRAGLVRLGDLPAYRYEGLRRPGSDRVTTLYVIPGRSGSLAIACYAPQNGARALLELCAASATTIVPAGTGGSARDSLERYLDRAGAVINRLARRREAGRRALARAGNPSAQALAAKGLVGDYRRAATRLSRIPGGGPASASARPLIRDLRATARAYRRLAVAAAQGAPGAFDAARRAIRSGEASVTRRLAAL